MVHTIVGLLERRGMIDEQWFQLLADERKNLKAEIETLKQGLLEAGASGSMPVWRTEAWEWRYRTAVRSALVLSTICLFTRCYPTNGPAVALRGGENALFGFLPHAHQRLALPALSIAAMVVAAIFWLLFQYNKRGQRP